jgi:hypothetical protein
MVWCTWYGGGGIVTYGWLAGRRARIYVNVNTPVAWTRFSCFFFEVRGCVCVWEVHVVYLRIGLLHSRY